MQIQCILRLYAESSQCMVIHKNLGWSMHCNAGAYSKDSMNTVIIWHQWNPEGGGLRGGGGV